MQNQLYQVVTPVSNQSAVQGESMTFNTNLEREGFIRLERSKGWEVFLSYQGTSPAGKELYAITRRAL